MKAKVNEIVDQKMLLRQSQAEVVYLRSLVAEGGASAELMQQLEELEAENQSLKEKVQNLTAEQCQMQSTMASMSKHAIPVSEAKVSTAEVSAAEERLRPAVVSTSSCKMRMLRRANSE